jgi:hypothetical protein
VTDARPLADSRPARTACGATAARTQEERAHPEGTRVQGRRAPCGVRIRANVSFVSSCSVHFDRRN